MTTKANLWLGFALVIGLLAASCVIMLLKVQSIDREVRDMSAARSYSTEVRHLHLGVVEFALAVIIANPNRTTADREATIRDATIVSEEVRRLSQLPATPSRRLMLERFAVRWGELSTLGESLLAASDSGLTRKRSDTERFSALRAELDALVETEIQPDAVAAYDVHSHASAAGIATIQNQVLILMVAGTLIGSVIAVFVSRTIVRNEIGILSGSEWLRVTLTSIGDGVVTTDENGRVTFLNPVAETLTGWSLNSATRGTDGSGMPVESVFRIVNESTRLPVENPIRRALREGMIVGLANHTILLSKNGGEISIDDSGAPIRRSTGQIAGAVLVFRDVTARKRQDRLVKDAFAYASNILDTQREPFLVLDRDLRVKSANGAFYRAFHVEPESTVGRFVYDLGDGQWNIPTLRELLEEVLPRRNAFDGFAVSHDFPGVGNKTMMINARRISTLGEDPELILLAIEDVTDRENAQRAQRESEVRFRRLFETAKDGILILDAHSRKITDANAFICGLTGREPLDLLGKELFEIGMYKDIEENKEAFRDLQRTGYLRHDHLPIKRGDGVQVEVEFVANIYREGPKLVAQCNVRDISERSRLEKEILKQSQALAAQSKGKDEFLAMLSHELRNPLAPIRAAVQLLKVHESPATLPVQQQAREIIERQVTNLTRMVSDLLEVSRVVSGRIQLDLKPIDIKQVVTHALQSTATLFEQRSHVVEVNLSPQPIWVLADATRLEEVLVNLLHNAAKYTPDGGRIIVTSDCDSHRSEIHVRDNGVGIDVELLPRIFDLFTQADRSLARSSGGLGIGLSLAHRLVGQHGGTIEAFSDGPGSGSQFTVRLPLIEQPAVVDLPGGLQPPEPPRLPGIIRVLVVDDNVDLVTMLASVLRHKGYRVQCAHTGPDGLALAKQWQPDIALLDIGLPGIDGYEIARRIRAASALTSDAPPPIRLFALTGYGRDADVALAVEAGFDGHLVKPCDLDELDRLISLPRIAQPKVNLLGLALESLHEVTNAKAPTDEPPAPVHG